MLELDGDAWASLYLSEIDLDEAIDSKKVKLKQGDKGELVAIFAMFDRYQPTKNIKIPSPDDMAHR
jgi:hypothetical protein